MGGRFLMDEEPLYANPHNLYLCPNAIGHVRNSSPPKLYLEISATPRKQEGHFPSRSGCRNYPDLHALTHSANSISQRPTFPSTAQRSRVLENIGNFRGSMATFPCCTSLTFVILAQACEMMPVSIQLEYDSSPGHWSRQPHF